MHNALQRPIGQRRRQLLVPNRTEQDEARLLVQFRDCNWSGIRGAYFAFTS